MRLARVLSIARRNSVVRISPRPRALRLTSRPLGRTGDYLKRSRDQSKCPATSPNVCPIVKQRKSGPLELPVGGRLKFFWQIWKNLGASRRVVRWLRHGYHLRFSRQTIDSRGLPVLSLVAPAQLRTNYRDPVKQQALDTMVSELLAKQSIREMSPSEQGYFSRVFLVPKRSGGYRLVIDLSELNTYLAKVSFSMDTLKLIKAAAQAGMWATSLDLSDAYHHIPMGERSQVFLCFQVGNRRFMFLVLPFGLATAPWVFTEVVKQIKIWSSSRLRVLFQYLDDWLNLFHRRSLALHQTQELVRLCARLGLLVNHKKSELIPKQRLVFLGEILDFTSLTAFATDDRKNQVCDLISRASQHQGLPFCQAESLLGLLTATFPTVHLGRLHLRWLQIEVIRVIRRGRHPQTWVPITGQVSKSLQWWTSRDRWTPGVPFRPPSPQVTVYTDASLKGWGIICEEASWSGSWNREAHINWLELRVILIALQVMRSRLQNKTVCFFIDNTTAVAYLNRQGGTHSLALLRLTFRIWKLAEQLKVMIIPRHIAGQRNVLADLASRKGQVLPAEWSLTPQAWDWMVSQSPWGGPSIDLFANRWNHQLPRYGSPCPDNQATLIDAMEATWPQEEILFAFPPPFLMLRFLQRLAKEGRAKVLLVTPWSPQAKWIPVLASLQVESSTPFPVDRPLLRQPHWHHIQDPPSLSNLRLMCIVQNGCPPKVSPSES